MQEIESTVYPMILYRDHVSEPLYPAHQHSQVLIYDDMNLDRPTPCSQRCRTCQQCLQWKKICPFKDREQIENSRIDASPFGIRSHWQPLRPLVNRKDFDFHVSLKSKK